MAWNFGEQFQAGFLLQRFLRKGKTKCGAAIDRRLRPNTTAWYRARVARPQSDFAGTGRDPPQPGEQIVLGRTR